MTVQKVIESLNEYTGDETSLNAFVETATAEIGPDWTDRIYEELGSIPPSLKEKLDHAFNYYAATTAWNEIQTYINQDGRLDYAQTLERIPVLEHWLAFFGAAGEEAVAQLQNRLKQEGVSEARDTSALDEPFAPTAPMIQSEGGQPAYKTNEPETESEPKTEVQPMQPEVLEQNFKPDFVDEEVNVVPLSGEELKDRINDIFSGDDELEEETDDTSVLEAHDTDVGMPRVEPVLVDEIHQPESDVEQPMTPVQPIEPIATQSIEPVAALPIEPAITQPQQPIKTLASVVEAMQPVGQPAVIAQNPLQAETEPEWQVSKIFKQLDFVISIQAWVSKRCHDLGYTDYYTYRYYGFLVDVLDTTIAELKGVLADTGLYEIIDKRHPDGVRYLQNQLLAFEKESKEAHDGVLADLSPLPREGLSVDDLKRNLGGMDTSNSKEYLGPAPDGFEAVDDPYAGLSDEALQKEYAKIEETGNLPNEPAAEMIREQSAIKPVVKPSLAEVKNEMPVINNTSQTPQNGVQRKMSFNFGPKKPTDSGGTGA